MKNALITGASSGIGLAFAKYYAKKSYHIILVSNQQKELEDLCKELQDLYLTKAEYISIDLSNSGAGERLYQIVKERKLDVDVLINAAGFGIKGKYDDSPLENIHQLMNIHIQTYSDLTYLFLKEMLLKDEGTIINIASVSAYNPAPYNAVYAACKSYILSLTTAIYYEYRNSNIKILAVCPMATKTHFFDHFPTVTGFMREPDDVVKTTMKALKKNKIMAVDGFLGRVQAILPHFGSLKMRVYINGWMCREWKNYGLNKKVKK